MRMLARMEGIPQRTGVELSLMDRFFLFQVIVRTSHVIPLEALLINIAERLFGRHSLVRYYCCFTWFSSRPIVGSDTLSTESPEIIDFLPDVGVS
jgi:hypothetical protein